MGRIGPLEILLILIVGAIPFVAAFVAGYFVGHSRGRTVGAREAERLIRGNEPPRGR